MLTAVVDVLLQLLLKYFQRMLITNIPMIASISVMF
jgi:hypothetical protein